MTIEETIQHASSNLDLSKVAALQQKRSLAFVNHFVITTVQFLNSFSKKCEDKLMQFESKLEKVEASMILLETRLSSIPEVNSQEVPKNTEDVLDNKENENEKLNTSDVQIESNKLKIEDRTEESATSYPEYDRFVKMVQVGVPLEAVKLKVALEGLDSNVLQKLVNK